MATSDGVAPRVAACQSERDYEAFIRSKGAISVPTGIEDVPPLGDYLFEFQKDLVRWALRRGKAAIFAAVGLGKTRISLAFAEQASAYLEANGEPSEVIILTPLSVAEQTVREGKVIGIEAKYCKDPSEIVPGVMTVTNYDRLERFFPVLHRFGVVVLDESSRLKHDDSKTRQVIIDAFQATPFRLACTATPAPNDRKELGNHAEFLGVMKLTEMLSEFFVHDSGKTKEWRLKGHAELHFWQWVASWGAMVTKPSDLGYSDERYNLPPLRICDHAIPATVAQDRATRQEKCDACAGEGKIANDPALVEMGEDGFVECETCCGSGKILRGQLSLFPMPATNLVTQRKARRATLDDRVKALVDIVAAEPNEQWLIWCELNDEANAVEKMLRKALGAASVVKQVSGSDSAEFKSSAAMWFSAGRCACEHPTNSANTIAITSESTQKNGAKPRDGRSTQRTRKSAKNSAPNPSLGESKILASVSPPVSGSSASPSMITTEQSPTKAADVRSVDGNALSIRAKASEDCTSTTVIEPANSEGSYAPLAISGSASSETIRTGLSGRCSTCGLSIGGMALVSKSSIFGFGLNFQSCARAAFVGVSHKFEEVHQALGRNHRFGQKREVHAHFVYSELEGDVRENLRRKARDFQDMANNMRGIVAGYVQQNVTGCSRGVTEYNPTVEMAIAEWLVSEAS